MKNNNAAKQYWQERTVIDYMQRKLSKNSFYPAQVNNGDDAYAYQVTSKRMQLITTDAMVENIHWKAKWCTPEDLAAKLVAVNSSDMAAMGGRPERAFLTLALPKKTTSAFVFSFINGLIKSLKHNHIDLCGGDTTASTGTIMLNLMLQGSSLSSTPMTRSAAQQGDLILVTGDLGAAAAGREALSKGSFNSEWRQTIINRFLRPTARLSESELLVNSKKIHALMDVSDGVASDIRRLCEASRTGAVIYAANLPVAVQTRLAAKRFKQSFVAWALTGGEDYELLFTCKPKHAAGIIDYFHNNCDTPCSIIGEITAKQKGLKLITPEGTTQIMPQGFEHQG